MRGLEKFVSFNSQKDLREVEEGITALFDNN
jgi:hypothetical protein